MRSKILNRQKGVFVTGTDTEVGKTFVSVELIKLLKAGGINVGVMKPVATGGMRSKDAVLLKKASGVKEPLELINPESFKHPLAPICAARLEKRDVNIGKIKECFDEIRSKHDFLVVEGIGGLQVPIKKDYLVTDLIEDLSLPVVIVASPFLGTINHTLLTVESLKQRGIDIKAIILNSHPYKKEGICERTNPDIIEEISGVPVYKLSDLSKAVDKIIPKVHKNLKAKNLKALDKKYLWHPFTQMKDYVKEDNPVIEEAKGSYLKSADGKWYLDGVSSLWVNVHGHRNKQIDDAIKRQLNKVSHSTLLGLGNEPSAKLSKELIEIAPKGLKKVFYSDSGSTAVEIALKMAFQYWQQRPKPSERRKRNFITFVNSYHGDTIGSVSVGGIDLFHKIYRPLLFRSYKTVYPYCYRCHLKLSYPKCKLTCIEGVRKLIKDRHKTTAAVVMEPLVQAAAGMLVSPPGFLKEVRRLCTKHNILLIVDEVAVGFGRTGRLFACEHEDVSPDLMTLAKGISGGYLPLAATLTSDKVFEGFLADYADKKTFFHGHTYTGNPLACQAALANLKLFQRKGYFRDLDKKINLTKSELMNFNSLKHVGDIRQKGLMVGIELVKDKKKKIPYEWKEKIGIKIIKDIRNLGIILRPLGNVIVLMPPLSISMSELRYLLKCTYDSIEKVTG